MNNIDANAADLTGRAHTSPLLEEERIQELYRYEIIATLQEADFDTITLLAAETFNTPYAAVNFVDTDDVFSKVTGSRVIEKTRKAESLSAAAIQNKEVTVFTDLQNEAVTTDSGKIRFYVAAPLISPNGFALGTISVTDTIAHPVVTATQIRTLQLLATMLIEKLENQLTIRNIRIAHHKELRRLAHDIKNPMTSISLYTQLLSAKEMPAEKVFGMAEKIGKSLIKMETSLNTIRTDKVV